MKANSVVIILVIAAILGLSGYFVALTPRAPISPPVTISSTAEFGNITSLSDLSSSPNYSWVSIPTVFPKSILVLHQVRAEPFWEVVFLYSGYGLKNISGYNDTGLSFMVSEEKSTDNYSFPFQDGIPKIIQVDCTNQLESTVCTSTSTLILVTQQNAPSISNFTLNNGAKGWGEDTYINWWHNGIYYQMSGFFDETELISVAN